MTLHDPVWMPLTPGQLDFWEEFCAHPAQAVSTVAHVTRIRGDVDGASLAQAIRLMAAEADVLALRFAADPGTGQPLQQVDPACRPVLHEIDLRPEADPEAAARARMDRDIRQPLDLRGAGLSALWLMRTANDGWLWYCRGHHIFLDGYAMALIERRVAQLYNHLAVGGPAGRPFGRFADYLAEDALYRQSVAHQAAQQFWRQRLAGGTPPEWLRKGSEDYPAAPREVRVDLAALADPLRAAALRHGRGWPDLLTALIALWLRAHGTTPAQQGERLLWLPLMNRMGSVSAALPAMVLNIVPWHLPDLQDAPLEAALARLAADLRTLRRHGRYRVEQMAADAGLDSRQRFFFSPLVNVMPFDPPLFAGCRSTREVLAAGPGDGFNITIAADSRAEGLALLIEADPARTPADLFRRHHVGLPAFLSRALDAGAGQRLSDLLPALPA